MKRGKLPENIINRAVFKQIAKRRKEVLSKPKVGNDCSTVDVSGMERIVLTENVVETQSKENGREVITFAVNDMAAMGAKPLGVMLSIAIPLKKREIFLRQLMGEIEAECAVHNMEILGGHTTVTESVDKTVVSVTGIGTSESENILLKSRLQPGNEIVMTKWAGLYGTVYMAEKKKEILLETLSEEFIDEAKSFRRYFCVSREAEIAKKCGAISMHNASEGGVFGALWEMGAESNVGITVDLKRIPIKQETIELSEVFEINPYQMASVGAMLIGCDNGNLLVEKLREQGINAEVIGRVTDSNDRVIVSGEETRFIEPVSEDEIYKLI